MEKGINILKTQISQFSKGVTKRSPIFEQLQKLVPNLLDKKRYKGQNGKIAVIGGSFEYTGAPYYAGIASLRGGGDIAKIICQVEAGIPIKSYSPELIVHPVIDAELGQCIPQILKILPSVHSLVIGPGLGRHQKVSSYIVKIIQALGPKQLCVLDADSLYSLSNLHTTWILKVIREKSHQIILTPNAIEFQRLWKTFFKEELPPQIELQTKKGIVRNIDIDSPQAQDVAKMAKYLNNPIILLKGSFDVITNGNIAFLITQPSSLKRTGGMGDILAGLTGLYSYWALKAFCKGDFKSNEEIILGCILSSLVTRQASFNAYQLYKLSLNCPDIFPFIGGALEEFVKI